VTTYYPTAEAVVSAALSQVGTTEDPPGSNLTPYGAAYGLNPAAWCGEFVWWAFNRAGLDLKGLGIYPAYTPAFCSQARARGWQSVPFVDARDGDVVFMKFSAGGDPVEHVGIATGGPTGALPTVEGNTSSSLAGSQSNGGGVFLKARPSAVVPVILRPPYRGGVSIGRVLRLAQPCMTGPDVMTVQHLVRAVEDGVYGPKTAGAVRAWQTARGITADGVWGPASTRAAGWVWTGA
jgi:peptidoglycan hydrolase-like protein with peptidoglycan-binding domain